MKLSDIPLEFLLLKDDWLTGANGVKGRMFSISHHEAGIFYDTYVTIRWNHEDHEKISLAKFPDECTNIEVDMSMYPEMLPAFCIAQMNRTVQHSYFWTCVVQNQAVS